MAVLDRARNVVVVRIVYDGPAGAGKTTTVHALAQRLGREATTPEEAGGRTLFFDWLDYTGGLFEEHRIRCQIVSVPGQAMLASRRDYLLDGADAVVYVGEVREHNLADTVEALANVIERVGTRDAVPVGVLLQANKSDLPGALPVDALREACEQLGSTVAVVPSVATDGTGVREAFVLAVRLALDRVRELGRLGQLEQGSPEVDDAETLLDRMRAQPSVDESERGGGGVPIAAVGLADVLRGAPSDNPHGESLASAALREMGEAASAVQEGGAGESPRHGTPLPPDASVPPGLVWPPVEGRVHVTEATRGRTRLAFVHGRWRGTNPEGWIFHSPATATFEDSEQGRGGLILLARMHTEHAGVLSPSRAVLLSPDVGGRWRLWQVGRDRTSLRQRLAKRLHERDPSTIARLLVEAASRLVELDARLRRLPRSALRATLDTTGMVGDVVCYVAALPDALATERVRPLDLAAELGPILRDWPVPRTQLRAAVRHTRAAAAAADPSLVQQVVALLDD